MAIIGYSDHMNSLEFTTKIERGVIHLPPDSVSFDDAVAHVVVTITSPEENAARKERLLAAFRDVQRADVFRSIEDPSKWQRKLRDEWE